MKNGVCLYAELTNFEAAYNITSVSLLTVTAINVDRTSVFFITL